MVLNADSRWKLQISVVCVCVRDKFSSLLQIRLRKGNFLDTFLYRCEHNRSMIGYTLELDEKIISQ